MANEANPNMHFMKSFGPGLRTKVRLCLTAAQDCFDHCCNERLDMVIGHTFFSAVRAARIELYVGGELVATAPYAV